MSIDAILASLNDGQRKAATRLDKDVLVMSPAGSGKTKTLQAAIVRILDEGYSPQGVLALTFTNKAADEMLARVQASVGEAVARRIQAGTFHGFCARTIRDYPHIIGRTDSFSIYDDDDRNDLARKVASEMGEKTSNYGYDAIRRKLGKDPAKLRTFDALYEETLVRQNALDYDGLETGMLAVLTGGEVSESARAELARLHHILVDEYQDTSPIQARIVAELVSLSRASVLRVGDPAQSIYGFRGAAVENIQQLAQEPGVTVVNLPVNYRSGRRIVGLGNKLAPGAGSPLDNVETGRDFDGSVDIYQHDDEGAAGEHIARQIGYRLEMGARPGQHMILARTWKDLDAAAAALEKAGIDHKIARKEESRWTTQGMRHVVAALRFLTNPRDVMAFRRLVSWPSEVVTTAEITRAESELHEPGKSLPERFIGVRRIGAVLAGLNAMKTHGDDPRVFAGAFLEASDSIEVCEANGLAERADELDNTYATLSQWAVHRASQGKATDAVAFLTWYACRHVLDLQGNEHDTETGPVRLMTVHAAKGLQARFVHVVGLEAKFWPQGNADDAEQAEERRVFYVAATRAEDVLALHTCRQRRATFGDKIVVCQPSPLLLPAISETTAPEPGP